ncbi:hypothetical protein OIU85_012631 [Salix viminalis]|uniref:Uncharacterized protein n=1 Tax=Salix viminalis TaxID=40686 RepID=A0A9Q0SDE7_SALVM|nr:hypothetical protein OIU85_012631 [Salix viminalis]
MDNFTEGNRSRYKSRKSAALFFSCIDEGSEGETCFHDGIQSGLRTPTSLPWSSFDHYRVDKEGSSPLLDRDQSKIKLRGRRQPYPMLCRRSAFSLARCFSIRVYWASNFILPATIKAMESMLSAFSEGSSLVTT